MGFHLNHTSCVSKNKMVQAPWQIERHCNCSDCVNQGAVVVIEESLLQSKLSCLEFPLSIQCIRSARPSKYQDQPHPHPLHSSTSCRSTLSNPIPKSCKSWHVLLVHVGGRLHYKKEATTKLQNRMTHHLDSIDITFFYPILNLHVPGSHLLSLLLDFTHLNHCQVTTKPICCWTQNFVLQSPKVINSDLTIL